MAIGIKETHSFFFSICFTRAKYAVFRLLYPPYLLVHSSYNSVLDFSSLRFFVIRGSEGFVGNAPFFSPFFTSCKSKSCPSLEVCWIVYWILFLCIILWTVSMSFPITLYS